MPLLLPNSAEYIHWKSYPFFNHQQTLSLILQEGGLGQLLPVPLPSYVPECAKNSQSFNSSGLKYVTTIEISVFLFLAVAGSGKFSSSCFV